MKLTRVVSLLVALSLALLVVSCGGGGNPVLEILEAELTLVKTANPTSYDTVGVVINYTFTVTNTGDLPISGPITIDDDKTTNETCPAITTVGNGNSVLDPAEVLVCTASYTIVQADIDAGSLTNVATATGMDPGGADVTSNAATVTVVVPLVADFTADAPSADPRMSMEAGTSSGRAEFEVAIHANGIADLFGVGFNVLYDPAFAVFVGCDARDSILSTTGGVSIPCNDAVVGGARFSAVKQNGVEGILNVLATKVGANEPGIVDGTGVVLTLTFEAVAATAGTPVTFEGEPDRLIETCPQNLTPCSNRILPWDEGVFTATAN